jgi:hypothetical protein
MGFIVDSLANVFLEILDTLIIWICDLTIDFKLDIGSDTSVFYTNFLSTSVAQGYFSRFGTAIGVMAFLIVLLVTIGKIIQLMADPFAQSESPGSIFLRFIYAGAGVIASYSIFKYLEAGFNAAYSLFSTEYNAISKTYRNRASYKLEYIEDAQKQNITAEQYQRSYGQPIESGQTTSKADAFLFGKENLINPAEKEAITSHPTAMAIIELLIGGALLICLVKLIFEIYERYVIIAVLYLFSPLAFATLISSKSSVFKNYLIMVVSQFVLMCSNLVFLGVFIRAWYDRLAAFTKNGYGFENGQEFVTFMLLMIGWLLVGQKMDELLRSLGLSAAQTGQGIMGAALGSLFMARAAAGALIGAGGAALNTTGKALTGQTGVQKAWQAGLEGKGGGLVGDIAKMTNKGADDKQNGALAASLDKNAAKGDSLDDALNNSIKGNASDQGGPLVGGTKAPQFGSADSPQRQAFDASNLDWKPLSGHEGIMQAYDSGSKTTITLGTSEAGNNTLLSTYGKTDTSGAQLDSINYGEGVQYYHVSEGNSVGSLPQRDTPKPS